MCSSGTGGELGPDLKPPMMVHEMLSLFVPVYKYVRSYFIHVAELYILYYVAYVLWFFFFFLDVRFANWVCCWV